jgi:uncharacterized protein YegP (UPF0339 family)
MTLAGKFEVYQDRSGKYRFRLKASNGQVVASSETYESRAAAMKGAESVQRAAASASIEELVGARAGGRSAPAPAPTASPEDSAEQGQGLALAARRREAVAEALASVRAEGLEPTLRGLELLEGVATGEVSEDAAIEALVRHHQR